MKPPSPSKRKQVESWDRWGCFQWCPKVALQRNKPGATHHSEHLLFESGQLITFKTRLEARDYIERKLGYIKQRPDLRAFPYYWRLPIPVKITRINWINP